MSVQNQSTQKLSTKGSDSAYESGEIEESPGEKAAAIAEHEARTMPRFSSPNLSMSPVDKPKPMTTEENTKAFKETVSAYLGSNPVSVTGGKTSELEISFGTNPKQGRPLTKIDYDNIVKQFYAAGFTVSNPEGIHMLRMQNQYYDSRINKTKLSNIRAEIVGLDMIQEYCKTNSIQKLLDMPSVIGANGEKIKFTQKTVAQQNEKPLLPVDFADFNFRVSYKKEQDFFKESNVAKNIIRDWTNSKKTFRYMNRVKFEHPDLPFFLDISIIKWSKKTGKIPIPYYTIQEAGVFENKETYEVELEVDNKRVGLGTNYDTSDKLLVALRKGIRIVLSGIQGTNYPIAFSEQQSVVLNYMRILHGKEFQERYVRPNDFVGPSSVTLQLNNLVNNPDSKTPSILKNYSVTDKADGERKLLYIHENGRIYLINTNMTVSFTGAYTEEKTLLNSLLDGEHIKYNKKGEYINLYAAFDIYYIQGKSVREYAFERDETDTTTHPNKFRKVLLEKATSLVKPKSIVKSGEKQPADSIDNCSFHVRSKQFRIATDNYSIFDGCASILSDIKQGIYEYNTDGLIFTPINTGVASNEVGVAGSLTKPLWDRSFKWKPAEFNTIDFLVSVKKDKNGQDDIHNLFQDGINLSAVDSVKQYKTLILRCGFDKENHRYINPFESIVSDNLPNVHYENEERYTPVPFRPTNPFDETACFCNVFLNNGELHTEEGEVFEESMIVEFRYDIAKSGPWKWIPLRVRYDKTALLRNGAKEYGNAYHVANNNWHSIHNPVTEDMIMTGLGIPDVVEDDDVYYNRDSREINTDALRDFHNLYVKKKLILGVAQRKNTLIDYAVGKAGDLPKWIRSHLGFVFGIDKSNANVFDPLDGACARYIKSAKDYEAKDFPKAIFLQGNSGNNIRSGKAFGTEKEKMIARAIFGNGPKDRQVLKEGVYKQYGIAQEGFNISSCQFALHYFFENNLILHEFLRNIAECTAVGGHFIGTCYDGKTVFKRLQTKNKGEGISLMKQTKKIFEITKMFDETGFPDDETSVGYMIHVYQDSINKTFPEYLVNFDYFVQMMGNYGFVLLKKEEAVGIGLPNGTGLFSDLFTEMEQELHQNPRKSVDYKKGKDMTPDEKWISFMNRYFVFRKMHHVDAERIYKQFVSKKLMSDLQEEKEELDNALEVAANVVAEQETTTKKTKIRKTTKKMMIADMAKITGSEPEGDREQSGEPSSKEVESAVQNKPAKNTKPPIVIGKAVTIKVKKPTTK